MRTSFVIRAEERNIYLRAKTQRKLDYWRNGLTLQMNLLNGGTSNGARTKKNQKKRLKATTMEVRHCVRGGRVTSSNRAASEGRRPS